MNKVLVYAIAITGMCIFAQIGFAALTASGSGAGPIISVEPPFQTVSKGENFSVDIYIDPEGNKTAGAAYLLYFNNTLLNATSLTPGTFFSGFDTLPTGEGINNTIGWIDYGEYITGAGGWVNDSGTFTTITFQAIGERGISELRFDEMWTQLSDPDGIEISNVSINNGTVEIVAVAPPTSFLVYGYVYYENDSKCNNPHVEITNLKTNKKWVAEKNESSNYYQLMLSSGIDINASEALQFEVTSPDGSQSNITSHTVTSEEINDGGLFNFNFTLEAKPDIFDTEAPDNPYPSIMGVHNGTIIPDGLIKANRIYTYACPGTGGHTEFVRIWGKDVDAHANWSGYVGEWHNLTFNTTFTLEKGNEYNYTIHTGSYPQIIHATEPEYEATGGKIKCTEFVDANGKKYDNWIPAFRLWMEEG